MSQKLWEANSQTIAKSNLFEFEKFLETKFNYSPKKNYKNARKTQKKNKKKWINVMM